MKCDDLYFEMIERHLLFHTMLCCKCLANHILYSNNFPYLESVCVDYINVLLLWAFYKPSFYCTFSNVTSEVVVNSCLSSAVLCVAPTESSESPVHSETQQRGVV